MVSSICRQEAVAVPALAFRLIEGGVGETHEVLAGGAVVRRERDADRDADADRRGVDLEGVGELIEDAARQRVGIERRAQPGLDDGELVAAEAGERVGPAKQLLEPARHELDQLVACLGGHRCR